jgi:hypothetical protein
MRELFFTALVAVFITLASLLAASFATSQTTASARWSGTTRVVASARWSAVPLPDSARWS